MPVTSTPVGSDGSQQWWRRPYPWLVVLGAAVVFNLVWALPRYLSGDSAQSRSILDVESSIHWPMLVVHVVTGNIAMITVFLQLWPWLRRNRPAVHKLSGRIYIFAGVLPSALLALFVLVPLRPDTQGSTGVVTMGVLWIATSLYAVKLARAGRYAEHRRWMIYSFALAMGTTWGRILYLMILEIPGFSMPIPVLVELGNWLGWVFNLIVAHLWVEWTAQRTNSRSGDQVITYPSPFDKPVGARRG